MEGAAQHVKLCDVDRSPNVPIDTGVLIKMNALILLLRTEDHHGHVTCPTTPSRVPPSQKRCNYVLKRTDTLPILPSIHTSFFPLCPFLFVHAPTEMTRARDNGTEQMGWQERQERQALPSIPILVAGGNLYQSQFVLPSLSFVPSFVFIFTS